MQKELNTEIINTLRSRLANQGGVVGMDKYLNSAVLIPIIIVDWQYHLLFEKRAKDIRQGGEVSFPGGEFDVEQDESFFDTALRETYEEIGYLDADMSSIENSMLIKEMKIAEKHQGKGYANILMRNMTNLADKEGITLRLKAEPFGERIIIDPDTGYEDFEKIQATPRTVRKLARFYRQFGFKSQGKVQTTTYGSYQYMVRRPK